MKKGFLLGCFSLLLFSFLGAQQVIPLYTGEIPGNISRADNEKSVTPASGRPSVVNVTRPSLTVFAPEHPDDRHASVIICPGGGYLRLTIEDGGYAVARSLAASGITAFVLKYRTWQDSAFSNFRELPLQDLRRALTIVYERAAEWKLDTTKIGLLGFSAGGHLAAMGATATDIKRTAFTVLAYPVISFTDSLVSKTLRSRSTLLGERYSNEEKEAYSPELHISGRTPPAFLVHAEDDSTSLVGNSIAYYKALVAHQVSGQLIIYPKGGHGFAAYNKAMEESWLPALQKWLSVNGFHSPAKPGAVLQAPPFYKEILAFKQQDAASPPPADPILMIGSSSFTKWKDVRDYFPGYPMLNRGFGGSTLVDLVRYAYDVIMAYHPRQILIYCGENDLASSDSVTADVVLQRFKTLFGIIRQNFPDVTIGFISIKPSPVRASIQGKVKKANQEIREFLKTQKKAQFIDIYDAMLDAGGHMRDDIFVEDRLHMKPEGYAIWKKIISPYLIRQ